MKRILPFLIILSVLGVALGSAWYLKRSSTANPAPPAADSPRPTTPALIAPGAEPPQTSGPATAPVKIEEFGDFECPPCGQFHPILKKMQEEFDKNLQVTFREFPIVQMHHHALAAASSAEAAGLQGKFWEMHHLLYDNQKAWHEQFDVRPIFEGYAKQIGLDVEQFKRDINSDLVARRITEDGKRARSLGVNGTPTVFMNGREMPFEVIINEAKLRAAIKAEIESAKR
ncbi:MAG TPA: thioredoxin domain-containing protein [Pyrinomonadaceae bacterium]|nr:thioredoxin domain-containing protein [Pyrinomonadaceae bacterium]